MRVLLILLHSCVSSSEVFTPTCCYKSHWPPGRRSSPTGVAGPMPLRAGRPAVPTTPASPRSGRPPAGATGFWAARRSTGRRRPTTYCAAAPPAAKRASAPVAAAHRPSGRRRRAKYSRRASPKRMPARQNRSAIKPALAVRSPFSKMASPAADRTQNPTLMILAGAQTQGGLVAVVGEDSNALAVSGERAQKRQQGMIGLREVSAAVAADSGAERRVRQPRAAAVDGARARRSDVRV